MDTTSHSANTAICPDGQKATLTTILLVEDDEALCESISRYLDQHGYKVLEASNGDQALHIASQHAESIQVLITDIILPKLSGAELAREVIKTSPQAVTLYISAYTEPELIELVPSNSTVEFLQKPFALQTLLHKLRELITARGRQAGALTVVDVGQPE